MARWGDTAGDYEADAIIAKRTDENFIENLGGIINFALLAGAAVWFAMTGSRIALALEILVAVWLTVSGVKLALQRIYTMLLIAERRAQILELEIRELRDRIG